MDYGQTLDWMFSRLPMFQRQGSSAYRKDLTNIRLLCDHLGNPQNALRCIHVAGTNGKGSTCHMLASVLQEAGYATGLFTSPHLLDFRERIRVNGQMIPKEYVVSFVRDHRDFFESHDLSFFEMTTGLGFNYFKEAGTEICVIETGMGGRLDSTNIINPVLSVITNIGLDHTQFLGTTLQEIAFEKAGIIKPKTPVVIGQANSQTRPVFEDVASRLESKITFAQDQPHTALKTDLRGDYQKYNLQTVFAALNELRPIIKVPQAAVTDGLENVTANTGLRGRWEILNTMPLVVCDTAHNADGLTETMKQVNRQEFKNLHFVLGMVNDKDLSKTLEILPPEAQYYFCRPDIPRGLEAGNLQLAAREHGLKGEVFDSVREAYESAVKQAGPDDMIYIGGSTFVVAEIL